VGNVRLRRPIALLVIVAISLVLFPAVSVGAGHWVADDDHLVSQPGLGQTHEPPVVAPISDPFRPPPQPWLPGNRGIEYAPTSGLTVRASAAGVVTFAGSVAGNLFVTVAHDSSLRTTVGFLDEISVSVGDTVGQGHVLGRAGDRLHFSARLDAAYIDPASLFQRYEIRVRLVR